MFTYFFDPVKLQKKFSFSEIPSENSTSKGEQSDASERTSVENENAENSNLSGEDDTNDELLDYVEEESEQGNHKLH